MSLAINFPAERRARARLYVEAPLGMGGTVDLPAEQAHYLVRVMRLGSGEPVALFNGRDGEWLGRIASIAKHRCSVAVAAALRPQTAGPDIVLMFAPVKRHPLDLLIRQATELGVGTLQPVLTARTVPERVNLDRLRAIAIEAAEQCGRLDLPVVADPQPLDRLLTGWDPGRRLFVCDETGRGMPIADALRTDPAPSAALLSGPEGGFTPAELDGLRDLPFVTAVVLGPRILRAETAALAALAVWQSVRGDWACSPPVPASVDSRPVEPSPDAPKAQEPL